jgi:hypothetical protein
MNGIQQVGFARTVISYETIDLVRKKKRSFFVIFEIGNR